MGEHERSHRPDIAYEYQGADDGTHQGKKCGTRYYQRTRSDSVSANRLHGQQLPNLVASRRPRYGLIVEGGSVLGNVTVLDVQ